MDIWHYVLILALWYFLFGGLSKTLNLLQSIYLNNLIYKSRLFFFSNENIKIDTFSQRKKEKEKDTWEFIFYSEDDII